MAESTDYNKKAFDDAKDTARNFEDQIVEQLLAGQEVSDDLHNDYPNGDGYHHENHVYKSYTLLQAANLLDQLSEHEEDDYSMWEGQPPREAVATQARYTYGNAVLYYWYRLVDSINGDFQSEFESELESSALVVHDAQQDAALGDEDAAQMLGSLGVEVEDDEDAVRERLARVVLNRLISEWNG